MDHRIPQLCVLLLGMLIALFSPACTCADAIYLCPKDEFLLVEFDQEDGRYKYADCRPFDLQKCFDGDAKASEHILTPEECCNVDVQEYGGPDEDVYYYTGDDPACKDVEMESDTPTTTDSSASTGDMGTETNSSEETGLNPPTTGASEDSSTSSDMATMGSSESGEVPYCTSTEDCMGNGWCWTISEGVKPSEEKFFCQDACLNEQVDNTWCLDDGSCCGDLICNLASGQCRVI